jgi:hypothetical protein
MGTLHSAFAALCVALVLAFYADGAVAQSQPASEAKVRELIAITNADQNLRQIIPAITQNIMGVVLQRVPNLTPEAKMAVTEAMQNAMMENASLFTEIAIPVYQKHLTEEEVGGWIAFMKTPVGQSYIEKSPLIAVDLLAAGSRLGQMLGEKARDAAVKTLRDKGYSL